MEQNLEPRKKYIGKLIYDKGEKKKKANGESIVSVINRVGKT